VPWVRAAGIWRLSRRAAQDGSDAIWRPFYDSTIRYERIVLSEVRCLSRSPTYAEFLLLEPPLLLAHRADTSMKAKLDIRDIAIAGHAQNITLRSFNPSAHSGAPIVLYFHGGGFVKGSLSETSTPASLIAATVPAWVIAVGYSLAPEFPFPAATEDAHLALEWAVESARQYRADSNRIAAVGHDAGGNIAAGLAAIARDRGVRRLSAQALLAPMLDPSMTRLMEGQRLDRGDLAPEDCARSYRAYLPSANHRIHPYAAPLESRRLGTLPPTLIATAEQDLVRADGETYARELITAGVPVEMTRHEGVCHGELISHAPALNDVVEFLRKRLAPV
jgi:acetyl esterase